MEWWNFWWIIFPLMGVAGGAAKAWERGARARHERRLEVMRAKAELRVARTGAIATAPAAAPEAEAPHRQQLQKLFAAHDDVTHRWLDYELDVAKLIAFPAMSDGRQPLTAAFLRAKKIADGLRPDSVDVRIAKDQLAEYRAAVTDYEVAFDVAERDARRIRDSSFSDAERKRLDTAKQLLTVAIDQAATPAERQLAYRRVREELDGLISVSDEAIDVLEKKVALELTTGTTDAAPPRQAASSTDAAATPAAGATAADTERRPVPPASVRPSAAPVTAPGRVVHPKPSH
ncbi:hypothetical protein ABC304_01215 [Microbacterium sp. 1P10UB]|uniref:hypothetical protein n=1 Tax=unclassified Microbacterium TaxID=2609290 RepID=UPI0039A1382B